MMNRSYFYGLLLEVLLARPLCRKPKRYSCLVVHLLHQGSHGAYHEAHQGDVLFPWKKPLSPKSQLHAEVAFVHLLWRNSWVSWKRTTMQLDRSSFSLCVFCFILSWISSCDFCSTLHRIWVSSSLQMDSSENHNPAATTSIWNKLKRLREQLQEMRHHLRVNTDSRSDKKQSSPRPEQNCVRSTQSQQIPPPQTQSFYNHQTTHNIEFYTRAGIKKKRYVACVKSEAWKKRSSN